VSRLFLLLLLTTLCPTLWAEDVLFVKNEWERRLHVWANDSYQGYVEPGQVAYMPQEGFVTLDSGLQPDGSMKMDHAYGGWEIRPEFKIVGASIPFEKDGTTVSFYSEGSDPYARGRYKLWSFGATTTGSLSPPEGVETEHAVKIRLGREPQTVLTIIDKGVTQATSNGSPITGLANNDGSRFPLKLAGITGTGQGFTNSAGMKLLWVDQGYYLAATEVTQDQWQSVMGGNPSRFKGGSLPVEQVDWQDAMNFCERLTQQDRAVGRLPKDHSYTLPTVAQWEHACRAGTTGDYAGPLEQMAWYEANSGERTHPVATKQPNAWGFYDMHGNVCEWCRSSSRNGYAYCGGGWLSGPEQCRSASSISYYPNPGNLDICLGFRPVAVPSQ